MAFVATLILGPSAAVLWAFGAGQSPENRGPVNPAQVDVCARVPGERVAQVFGGLLKQARPFVSPEGEFSRCTYILNQKGHPETPLGGYTLWLYGPGDYADLLAVHEGPYETLSGFGDRAILFQDEDERWKLRLLREGRFTLEATAADAESAKKLARLALGLF